MDPKRSSAGPQTMQVQPQGLCFAAAVTMSAGDAAAPERRFSGVAYAGGVITDHGWWDAVSFDLAGITAASPMPVLLQHNIEAVIGVIDTVTNDGQQLAIGGKLFTGIDPAAQAVAAKADAGAPWQMSVGIFPDRIEEISAGAAYTVNGHQATGPGHIFRVARVREVSFVALGADAGTRANVFSTGGQAVDVPLTRPAERHAPMSDANTPTVEQLTAQLATATAERDAAVASEAAMREQFTARERTERETAVKALLGEAFSTETAAPYLDMTAVQFAAVQGVVQATRSKLPPGFTAEQASAGSAGNGLTPEGITKYRRDNPGASYEQAFAALTTAA